LVNVSEATVKLLIGGEELLTAAEGNGPVNALDTALRKGLAKHFPQLKDITLTDFKVRIINSNEGTKAVTRVMIESEDTKGNRWTTLGVSGNLTDAAFDALIDSVTYKLMRK
jgi:2-isopropylmalate synthase